MKLELLSSIVHRLWSIVRRPRSYSVRVLLLLAGLVRLRAPLRRGRGLVAVVHVLKFELDAADEARRHVVDDAAERAEDEAEDAVEDGDADYHQDADDEAARAHRARVAPAARHHRAARDHEDQAVDDAEDDAEGGHRHGVHRGHG